MPRPRVHDPGHILDTAEHLVAERGPAGITIRGLAAASGVSNGAIYHAFGSLPAVLGHAWLRAAGDFLDLQVALVDAAQGRAENAVCAAAAAPADFAQVRPAAARMLMGVRRDSLLGPDLPQALADDLLALDRRLLALLQRLARAMWGRADAAAVGVITLCVVDLPTAVFRRALLAPAPDAGVTLEPDSRARLDAAVRAVLALPPAVRAPSRKV